MGASGSFCTDAGVFVHLGPSCRTVALSAAVQRCTEHSSLLMKAGYIAEAKGQSVRVEDVVLGIVEAFGTSYGRYMEKLYPQNAGELGEAILALKENALAVGGGGKV